MTFIILIGGVLMITYAIASMFVPTVDKTDLVLEEYIFPGPKEKPIEITKISDIVEVTPCTGKRHLHDFENVEIVAPMYTYYDVPLSDEIQQYIQDQCLEKFGTLELCGYNLPKLVINIIRWESGFDQDNDNGKCCGLMSVTHNLWPGIVEDEQITNLIEPDQNLRAGIRIFHNAFDQSFFEQRNVCFRNQCCRKDGFDMIVTRALNYYHTGISNDSETDYVNHILSTYETTKERS